MIKVPPKKFLTKNSGFVRLLDNLTSQGGILVAWWITTDGRRGLLYLVLGGKESYDAWFALMRGMVKRVVNPLAQITSDGAPGVI